MCGNGVLDPGEKCDTGSARHKTIEVLTNGSLSIVNRTEYNASLATRGYLGCSSKCDAVLPGYRCPKNKTSYEAGLCSSSCGNGLYEGKLPEFGRPNPLFYPEEECDDGNDVDGDGCSYMCKLEDPTKELNGTVYYC